MLLYYLLCIGNKIVLDFDSSIICLIVYNIREYRPRYKKKKFFYVKRMVYDIIVLNDYDQRPRYDL